jgi:hypothetical protein
MRLTVSFECKNCLGDLLLSKEIQGKNMPDMKNLRDEAQKEGWMLGRDCYCPDCYKLLPAHCNTCEHYEGNKCMGAPICRKDGKFATPTDYCDCYKSMSRSSSVIKSGSYINPVPTID